MNKITVITKNYNEDKCRHEKIAKQIIMLSVTEEMFILDIQSLNFKLDNVFFEEFLLLMCSSIITDNLKNITC